MDNGKFQMQQKKSKKGEKNKMLITLLLIIVFSLLAFFIAYFLGTSIYKKKYGELSELDLRIVDANRKLEA